MGEQYTVVEVFRSRVVLVGVHLGSEDEQAFDGLEVELANLTAWTQRTGIDRRSFYKADEDGSDKLKFRRITVDPQ